MARKARISTRSSSPKTASVAVGAGATFTSHDGEKWTRAENENAPLTCVFGKGAFIGTRWKGRIFRSADAITWKEVHKCARHFECVTFGGA